MSPWLLRREQVTSLVAGLTTTVQCLVAPQEYLATLSDITSLLTMLEEEEEEGEEKGEEEEEKSICSL